MRAFLVSTFAKDRFFFVGKSSLRKKEGFFFCFVLYGFTKEKKAGLIYGGRGRTAGTQGAKYKNNKRGKSW